MGRSLSVLMLLMALGVGLMFGMPSGYAQTQVLQTLDDRHLPVIARSAEDLAKIAAILAAPDDFTVALRSDSSSEMLPGAVEGEFSVNIRLDPGAGDSSGGGPPLGGGRPAFTLAKKYRIEAKEINELTVIVE